MMHWKPFRLNDSPENWVEFWMNNTFTAESCDFGNYMYMIDGVKYMYLGENFRTAFKKEFVWQSLHGFWPPSLRDKQF